MSDQSIKERAREQTREILSLSSSFSKLPAEEQRAVYKAEFQRNYDELSRGAEEPFAGALAGRRRSTRLVPRGPQTAGEMIDDERHQNERIDQAGDLAGDFIENVDFPGFVRDLLKGVFDANLEVALAQMEQYQKLLQTATASLSKYINSIDDTAAFGYLAENNDDSFGLGEDGDGAQKTVVLTDKDGTKVDTEDTRIKTAIMDAKIAMAKEQRRILRESLIMGVTRLVVEEGNVKASVLFDIKASEQIEKKDKAGIKASFSSGSSISGGTGLIGKIFGGGGGGRTTSRRRTKISVASAKSENATELTAKLSGTVDIKFKSDYFELSRFGDVMLAEIAAESGGDQGGQTQGTGGKQGGNQGQGQ